MAHIPRRATGVCDISGRRVNLVPRARWGAADPDDITFLLLRRLKLRVTHQYT